MLIRRLILENYGLFAGRHEFDLVPRTKYGARRPIVLFGGKNGAGKTTILEAIRLVLYGRTALGGRVRSVDYDTFLRGRVHRDRANPSKPAGAALAIEFDHVHRGNCDRYLVQRSWNCTGTGCVEQLSVLRNEKQLDEVDAEFWQGFVRDIIPEGLSQLFFFDGEKIRELAEDATGSTVLADSIKSLLGLDLVERLHVDLSVYANREVAKLGSVEDRARAAQLEDEILALRHSITEAKEQLAENRTRQDGVNGELRRAEENLRREGDDLAQRRGHLHSEAAELNVKIALAEKQLREQCEGVFPLALCPQTASRLKKQLSAERSLAHAEQVSSALDQTRRAVMKALNGKLNKVAGATAVNTVKSTIESVFAEQIAAATPKVKRDPLHNISENDQRRITDWLSDKVIHSRSAVSKLCQDLSKAKRREEYVDRGLAQIPSDDAVRPQVEAFAEANRRLGSLEQVRAEIEERLRSLQFQLETKERDQRKLAERYEGGVETSRRIELARSVKLALDDYLKRLTQLKVAQLRETVANCFNHLCRKGDVIRGIDIDPETYGVTLYDQQNIAVAKEELSSGEKQIFAIAMLWGLAQTSGRPLPVIIDTPLGRLDSEHRRNLIEQYFAHASHQVVLLSTDTEVDQSLFEQLSPEISHSFQLLYEADQARTRVVDGYFWRGDVNG